MRIINLHPEALSDDILQDDDPAHQHGEGEEALLDGDGNGDDAGWRGASLESGDAYTWRPDPAKPGEIEVRCWEEATLECGTRFWYLADGDEVRLTDPRLE